MKQIYKFSDFIRGKNVGIIGRSTCTHIMGSLITFIFTIACTRLLSTHEYGDIRYAMVLLPIFMSFGLPGADGVILKHAYLKKPVSLFSVYRMRLMGGIIGSILIFFWITYMQGGQWTSSLWAVFLCLPFYDTATGYKNFLVGRGLKELGLNRVLFVRLLILISILFLIILVSFKFLPTHILFPGYMVSLIVPTTVMYFIVARSQRVSFHQKFTSKNFFFESFLSSCAGFISVFSTSIDKIYLGHTFGSGSLALYSILLMFPQEIARLVDTFVPLYYDRFFLNKTRVSPLLGALKFLPVIFLLLFVYGVSFCFISPIVFGPEYNYSGLEILFSVVFLCSCTGEYFSFHRVFALHSLTVYIIFLIFGGIILYSLITIMAPIYGVTGVLGAVILKQLAMSSIAYSKIFRFYTSENNTHYSR